MREKAGGRESARTTATEASSRVLREGVSRFGSGGSAGRKLLLAGLWGLAVMIGGTPPVAAQGRGNPPTRSAARTASALPAAPAVPAAPTAPVAPAAIGASRSAAGTGHDAVKEHEERVAALEQVVSDLRAECWREEPALRQKEEQAVVERATKRAEEKLTIYQKDLAAAHAAVQELADDAKKLENDLGAAKSALAKATTDGERQAARAKLVLLTARQIANEAAKKSATERETQLAAQGTTNPPQLSVVEAQVKTAFAQFGHTAPDAPVGICKQLCQASPPTDVKPYVPAAESPLDLCAFQTPALVTAAVIADWPSVDALSRYVGAPRAGLEASFDIVVPELPKDAGESRRGKDVGSRAEGTKGAPRMAGSGAMAAIDLSGTAAQTAGVALAALAKVIEDRAKRETLVWFLEQMSKEVCGDEEKAAACDADRAEAARKIALDADAAAKLAQEAATTAAKKASAALEKAPDDPKLATALKAASEGEKAAIEAKNKAAETLTTAQQKCAKALSCATYGPVTREVRAYWLPMTCAVAAKRENNTQYGGGAHLLRALQGAVASDVRNWPGVAAGAGTGALYWSTTPEGESQHAQNSLERMFHCDPANPSDKTDPLCPATVRLRRETAQFVTKLQNGNDALVSMGEYGDQVDLLNAAKDHVYNDAFQIAACMLSVPRSFQATEKRAKATTSDRKEEIEAQLLASLGSEPACWTVFGNGWKADACAPFGGKEDKLTKCELASQIKDRKAPLERLTTLLRLHAAVAPATDRLLTQWGKVQSAWEVYLAAFEAMKKSGGGTRFSPPASGIRLTENDAQTLAEVLARSAQNTEQVKLARAAAGLARASLELGVVLTDGLSGVAKQELYPGLHPSATLDETFAKTSQELHRFSGYVTGVESALDQDWGGMVARIVALLRNEIEKACLADKECSVLAGRLSRYSGLFTALVTETDPERVAQALDAAAMPIGGWRHKQVDGATTVTVGAFPGLTLGAGFELRWGQYGVVRERGKDVYWTPPVLQMPFGVDIAHGYDAKCGSLKWGNSWGLFVSLLDPAAYLSYDPDNEGRLPGAQILTALAPGLALHHSLGESPFVLTGYAVVRPNFRSWQSDVAAPGATVLQIGASVAVDVSLFEVWAKRPE